MRICFISWKYHNKAMYSKNMIVVNDVHINTFAIDLI